MLDILGAVNDFILAFCKNGDELPPLEQRQVVIGWQNVVSLPKDTQEIAVITLLDTIRHGTNVHDHTIVDPTEEGGEPQLIDTVGRIAEHLVQVDFCCAHPRYAEERARMRAEIVEILARDRFGVEFFNKHGLSSCYAEDVRPLPYTNEASQQVARYSVTMHLTAWTKVDIPVDSFAAVNVRIENVDVHHNP